MLSNSLLLAPIFLLPAIRAVTSFAEVILPIDSRCSAKVSVIDGPVFNCEEAICQLYPDLNAAGCCEAEGCTWTKSCLPHFSYEEQCSSIECSGNEDTMICNPSRPFCQKASIMFLPEAGSDHTFFTCSFEPNPSNLVVEFPLPEKDFLKAQSQEQRLPTSLHRRQAEMHMLFKRASGDSIGGLVGGVIVIILVIIGMVSCFSSKSNTAAREANEDPDGNNTMVYVLATRLPRDQQQQPQVVFTHPDRQPLPTQPQAVYVREPFAPPGAQALQAEQIHDEPPPPYRK